MAKARGGTRKANVAGRRNFQAAAETPSRDPGDDRNGKRSDRIAQLGEARDEKSGRTGFQLRHLADVGAADECLVALAAQNQRMDRCISG
jgi:hypothetical protein